MSTRASRKGARPSGWYLLIHQLPPEPLYLRAKIRQRLVRVGAVALKKAVYALPRRAECLEDLQWIAEEAIAGGGEAYVCEARFPDAKTDRALIERFGRERDADYEAVAAELSRIVEDARRARRGQPSDGDVQGRLSRARKRLAEIEEIDFFRARGRRRVDALLVALERELARAEVRTAAPPTPLRDLAGKTWVTRRGVHIDRIASAWFIRRFVDADARFRFGDPSAEPRGPGEIVFDAPGGDFTHEGDRCSLETLIRRSGVRDRALRQVAEIVHDIDLKDSKFGRPEARGVEQLLAGILRTRARDEDRLQAGLVMFDELYESFRARSRSTLKEARS